MLGIGAGSRSGLSSDARGIAGARSAFPCSSRSRGGLLGRDLARLGLGSRTDFMAFSRAAFTSGVITLMGSAVETW